MTATASAMTKSQFSDRAKRGEKGRLRRPFILLGSTRSSLPRSKASSQRSISGFYCASRPACAAAAFHLLNRRKKARRAARTLCNTSPSSAMDYVAAHLWSILTVSSCVGLVVLALAAWLVRGDLVKIAKVLAQVRPILWSGWCLFYLIRWRLRFVVHNVLVGTTLGVLLVSSSYVVIEICLTIARLILDEEPRRPKLATHQMASSVAAALDHTQHLPRPPLWIEFVLLTLALLIVQHHITEWRSRKRAISLPIVIELLLLRFVQLRNPLSGRCGPQEKAAFLENLFGNVRKLFGREKGHGISFSLMEPNAAGELVITFVHPSTAPIAGTFKLNKGEGAAGIAYLAQAGIYVPSTRHQIGINVETNTTVEKAYKPDQGSNPFRSVLCTPVVGAEGVLGVLNIAAERRSAFAQLDFGLAKATAALISVIN